MALSFKDLLLQNEFWAFLFILGWVLFNWPMLTLTVGYSVMGIPAVLVYIALIWLTIILVLYLFDRRNSG
jgi:TRAP-type C4-dicarboxylate transport system permease small subunit